jgi:WhiB family transcriptional regulator, redox-sensing transcriptional regulator
MDEASWMVDARCRDMDPDIFFPSDGLGVESAQKICAECPVKNECLEYALEHHVDHGVWGGVSERGRRRILRERRISARKQISVSNNS